MAVYVAVYVLPSWIENMLTAWEGFLLMRGCEKHTVNDAHTLLWTHKYTLTHKADHLKINTNITLVFFLYKCWQHQIHSFRIACRWAQIFCQTMSMSRHVAIDQSVHQLTWSAVDEQVIFQLDKCQHAPYTTLKLHCWLFVTPSYGSQISLIVYRLHHPPPSATFHLAPGQSRGRMAVGRWTLGEWSRLGPPH